MGEAASAIGPMVSSLMQSQGSGSGGGQNPGEKAEEDRLELLRKKYGLDDMTSLGSFLRDGGDDTGFGSGR